jgi:hypothetical protein
MVVVEPAFRSCIKNKKSRVFNEISMWLLARVLYLCNNTQERKEGRKGQKGFINATNFCTKQMDTFEINWARAAAHREREDVYISEGKIFCLKHMNNVANFGSFQSIWVHTSQSNKQRALKCP